MTESSFTLSEIKLALKRKDLAAKQYKLQNSNPDDVSQGYLTFFDIVDGTKVSGKIVRFSNEKDHWPLLNHENVAPLLDVLNIRSDLKIYLTIDIQVKLKDIIHKEDFVYNSRCFDRKKAYAKGIFSGLSYIHGKSLCLMNLSDDNIYICNTHDKVVITNFSFISCSRKTTRDKLKVPEHYKAPETGKHEFDAIAAEMWTSGSLMLDLFLAHMVPWAVIDYKPRRVMEMVNQLSLDLLQAANAGSVITVTDLVKFKAFLKCFFKESQSRITAWLASISSFLSVKLRNKTSPKRMFIPNCFPRQTEKKYSFSDKKSSKSIIPKTDSNLSNFLKNNNSNDSRSQEYFDYNESSTEIYLDVETPNWLKWNHSECSGSNCSERDESFSTGGASSNLSLQDFNEQNKEVVKTERNVKKNHTEITCDKQIRSDREIYHGSEDKEDSFSTSKIVLNKTSKSCQMIQEETNEFNIKYHKSKSLSFMNYDGISRESLVKISYSKTNFCSSVRSLPVRKSDKADLKKSDFCLNRLFENKEWLEESMTEKKVSHKVLNTVNTRNFHNSFDDFITYEPKNRKISQRKCFKEPEVRLPLRDSSPNSNNNVSIKRIKERFLDLRKAEISLKDHNSLFISEELAEKQQNLINEYRDLMRKEKIRLCEVLSNEYKLSISEIKKLSQSFGSKPRYIRKHNRRPISNKLKFISSELSECKLEDIRERGKTAHRTTNYVRHKLKDSEDELRLKPRKRLSYCKAIESSANQIRKNYEYRLGEKIRKDPEIKSKLILTENKPKLLKAQNGQNTTNWKAKGTRESQTTKNSNCHQLNPILEDSALKAKLKDSKELLITRKKEKKSKKDIKIAFDIKKTRETTRKPVCFSLCPGGTVEKSASFDDLCEACKLGYGVC